VLYTATFVLGIFDNWTMHCIDYNLMLPHLVPIASYIRPSQVVFLFLVLADSKIACRREIISLFIIQAINTAKVLNVRVYVK